MNTVEDFPRVGNYSFKLDIEGWPLQVTYKYHFISRDDLQGYDLPVKDENMHHVHFEFKGRTASETGYRSHFCHIKQLVGDPYDSAWLIAQGLYKEVKKKHPRLLIREVQLSLF